VKLIVATGNSGKVKEITDILSSILPDTEVLSLKDIYDPVPDIPETESTFEANCLLKAEWLRSRQNCWVLADDSGLEVDFLQGDPGVFSARYAGEPSNAERNMIKLISELHGVPLEQRNARFRCVMALMSPEGKSWVVEGDCEGHIQLERSGSEGFGYDPLFVPIGFDQTFAELGKEIKNRISHRAKALRHLSETLQEIFK